MRRSKARPLQVSFLFTSRDGGWEVVDFLTKKPSVCGVFRNKICIDSGTLKKNLTILSAARILAKTRKKVQT